MDRGRALLGWWRVPIMTALAAVGTYYIERVTVWLWIGMAVTLVGEAMQLWAAAHLRKDKSLTTSGPYSYVRNPMYLGRFFVLLGFVVMVQGAQPGWTILRIPMLVVAYVIGFAWYVSARVGREEARLRVIFGEDYESYCREVRRFLPGIRPYARASRDNWQWSKLVTNHEYRNLIAILAVFAAIIVRAKIVRL